MIPRTVRPILSTAAKQLRQRRVRSTWTNPPLPVGRMTVLSSGTESVSIRRGFTSPPPPPSQHQLSEEDIKKRLDGFQDLFVEARLCLEDVMESAGTKYFDEDAEAAQESVQEAVDAFQSLVDEIEDLTEKNRVLRGNGLKVEQLKGELDLALKGGH